MDWAMQEKSYSQRRACSLAGIDPRVYRRKPVPDRDADLRVLYTVGNKCVNKYGTIEGLIISLVCSK